MTELIKIHYDPENHKANRLAVWGTFGENGTEPLKYVAIKDMTENHIKAVLKTQHQAGLTIKAIMKEELFQRGVKQ